MGHPHRYVRDVSVQRSAAYGADLVTYCVHFTINKVEVVLKIDSGCHESIINKKEWHKIGKPLLEPVLKKRRSVTGAEVPLLGQFIATVHYSGKIFHLPIQVSANEDTRNLLGRRSFPILNLDWNKIFHRQHTNEIIRGVLALPHSDYMLSQARLASMCHATTPFYVSIQVNTRFGMIMMLDTGATQSKISKRQWEILDKPRLRPSWVTIVDTANIPIPILGECMLMVVYQGLRRKVPVIVTRSEHMYAIIGTNWFESFRFDFNRIFFDLKIHVRPSLTQPIQVQTTEDVKL